MEGIVEGAMETTTQRPAEQAQPAQGRAAIPPQVMQAFQKAGVAAMKLLYSSPETAKRIVAMVAQAEAPEEGIAQATELILGKMRESAKGGQAVIERMAGPVAAWIAEMAVVAGVIDEKSPALKNAWALLSGQQPQQEQQESAKAESNAGLIGQNMEV